MELTHLTPGRLYHAATAGKSFRHVHQGAWTILVLPKAERETFIREKRRLTEGQPSIKAAAYTIIIQ